MLPVRLEPRGEVAVTEQRVGVLGSGRRGQVAVRGEQQVPVDQEPAAMMPLRTDRRQRGGPGGEDRRLDPLRPTPVVAATAGAEAPPRALPPHPHWPPPSEQSG